MPATGADPSRPLRLVVLPGLDATGTQHADFAAALRARGWDASVQDGLR